MVHYKRSSANDPLFLIVCSNIYINVVVTKKSPLSILRHLRVVNSAFLKQRFDGCLFQVPFYCTIFSLFTIIFIKVYTYYTLQFSLETS